MDIVGPPSLVFIDSLTVLYMLVSKKEAQVDATYSPPHTIPCFPGMVTPGAFVLVDNGIEMLALLEPGLAEGYTKAEGINTFQFFLSVLIVSLGTVSIDSWCRLK